AIVLSYLSPDFFIHDPSKDDSPFLKLGAFTFISFALGPIMVWITHRFFRQTKVVYIILFALGIPALIIGILVGIGSFNTMQDIQSADIPGENNRNTPC
ncbi:hypothetical protein N9A86_02035, partial [Akkermansiaceae bacterium]|nr:hypothetical protein [Akkermansiaceae bacterium]